MIKKMMGLALAMSILVSGAVMPAFAATPAVTTSAAASQQGVISVNGSGNVVVKPDIAYIQVGYEAKNKDASLAQKEAKEKMVEIIKQLKAQGVKDADVKTVNVSLYKNYDYDKEVKTEYYVASNSVEVTVRNIDKVGDMIDVAVNAGSNQLGSVRFGVENQEKYQLDALKLAIKNAGTKANTIANVIEVKIGKPSKVTENSYSGGIIYREAMSLAKNANDGTTPVEVGSITISADVVIEYKY